MSKPSRIARLFRSGISLLLIIQAAPAPAPAAAGPATASEISNVLVVVLDALRADHLGCYGYHRNTSPNIDVLAENGVVFDRAIVPAGWTKPSVVSLFSSLYPGVHQVLHYEEMFPPNLPTLAEVFRENGFFTCGFVNNVHIDSSLGFDKGFDVYRKLADQDICHNLWEVFTGRYFELGALDDSQLKALGSLFRENPDRNLVVNGGFEISGLGWGGDPGWLESGVFHSGGRSMHLDRPSCPGSNFYHLNQTIVLEHGEEYFFGGFVRTRNLEGEVRIEIYELEARRDKSVFTNQISGTNDWTLLLGRYSPQSCDAQNRTEVTIRAGRVADFQGGEFWVDDVFIFPLDRLPSLLPADRKFIYAHFINPHGPYTPSRDYLNLFRGPPAGSSLIDKYDGEIREQDARLGLLFEALKARGILDRTLVVITSDHGEEFGERGEFGHGAKFFHEEVARVPLIYYNQRLFPEPQRRSDPVESSVDLLPSLIDLLSLSVPEGAVFQGKSYFNEPRPVSLPAYLYETPYTQVFWDDLAYVKTVNDGKWKYITDRYRAREGDWEIEGVWRDERGVELTVSSSRGKEEEFFPSISDLEGSRFFKSRSGKVQEVLKSVYLAAEGREAMLFNLEVDPGEKTNLAARHPDKVAKYQKLIDERFEADRVFGEEVEITPGSKAVIGEETRKELRALGYLN